MENLLKEINFLANSKGTNAFIRGKLSELHRAVREQEADNERLRETLKFYATATASDFANDNGFNADAALAR